ncbi:MAG: hypothetical protein V1798_03775 [Pseudomonadota bacterium]
MKLRMLGFVLSFLAGGLILSAASAGEGIRRVGDILKGQLNHKFSLVYKTPGQPIIDDFQLLSVPSGDYVLRFFIKAPVGSQSLPMMIDVPVRKTDVRMERDQAVMNNLFLPVVRERERENFQMEFASGSVHFEPKPVEVYYQADIEAGLVKPVKQLRVWVELDETGSNKRFNFK